MPIQEDFAPVPFAAALFIPCGTGYDVGLSHEDEAGRPRSRERLARRAPCAFFRWILTESFVMAENETAGVAQEGQEQGQESAAEDYTYDVRVEENGPGSKKVTIEIPHDRI